MAFIAVTYTYADAPERLDETRPEHRAYLGRLHEAGTVVVSGPLPASSDHRAGALLILRADDADDALRTLQDDPFQVAGLIEACTAREWVPVIGSLD
ncbi:YciI family protein [Isoptericola jiangsuensis]|uniref:YciI family protein n=1 Tax=Isoptericola jiangsuensis TaxID=548579 RepID=UPI003AAE9B90